ncbi:hypothetical protein Q1695_015720 [Nippostrongylus brasiliensis]|nr:hypothetical protein Q1695_015720 [Nippostrongylus brasiliensis]
MSASPNLKCGLCNDFLVNAVSVAGCMHSFCESCLLKSLAVSGICPTKGCKKNVDKNGYRRDPTLQMLVYKFVPRVFFNNAEKEKGSKSEVSRTKQQRELTLASSEICDPDEPLSICLEFVPAPSMGKPDEDPMSANPSTSTSSKMEPPPKKARKVCEQREVHQIFRRFFRCAARVPIRTVRRLLETKLFLTEQFSVHFISDRDFQDIPDDVTLRTLVLDGGFDRTRPFRLFFTLIPTMNDDAPPVLDVETMPCLMPEAPVHQEMPSSVQPPGQLQPVQIVSPVVPALTVSLSTDIYGHSAPIITPQSAPRKRRKQSDSKKSPTEKSPSVAAAAAQHQAPIAPNMLVGPLIRPMFIAQPPFMHRSPPNMHIQLPTFPQQHSQAGNHVESPSKKFAAHVSRSDADLPPQLQREDPVMSTVPTPTIEPVTSTSVSSINQLQNSTDVAPIRTHLVPPPHLESSQQIVPLPPTTMAPPVSIQLPVMPSVQPPPPQFIPVSISLEGPADSKPVKMDKPVKPKIPATTQSTGSEPKLLAKICPEPKAIPISSPYVNGTSKPKESPPRLEAMTCHSRPQSTEKRTPQPPRLNSSQITPGSSNSCEPIVVNSTFCQAPVVSSAPKPRQMVTLPVIPAVTDQHPRLVQTVLPQPPNAEIRLMPSLPTRKVDSPPPPVQPILPIPTVHPTLLPPPLPRASLVDSRTASPVSRTSGSSQQPMAGAASPPTSSSSSTGAPMDFRRMATLNKQSLGRTLQAVLSSGRAANADSTKGAVLSQTSLVPSPVGPSADIRSPPPINGKVEKEAAVDLHYPSTKSVSI